MNNMWEAIQYVTTGLSLAAFIVAAIVFVLRAQINRDRKLIQTVPEQERGPLVDHVLGGIDTRGFKPDHKRDIALEQLRDRSRRFLISAIVIVILALIAAAISIVALVINPSPEPRPKPDPKITTTLTSARLIWPKSGISDPSQYPAAGFPTITNDQIEAIRAVVEDQTVANGLKPFFPAGSVGSPMTCDLTFPIWDDSGGFADKESVKVGGTMDRDHTDEVRASIAALKFPTPQRPPVISKLPGLVTPEQLQNEIQNAPTHIVYYEVRMEIQVTLPSN